jgi:hypothetical protein
MRQQCTGALHATMATVKQPASTKREVQAALLFNIVPSSLRAYCTGRSNNDSMVGTLSTSMAPKRNHLQAGLVRLLGALGRNKVFPYDDGLHLFSFSYLQLLLEIIGYFQP